MPDEILLINPAPSLSEEERESVLGMPLGLLSVGSMLALHKARVIIIDGYTEPDFRLRVSNILKTKQIAWIGVSVMTISLREARDVSLLTRRLAPDTLVCWGGGSSHTVPERSRQRELRGFCGCWGRGNPFC